MIIYRMNTHYDINDNDNNYYHQFHFTSLVYMVSREDMLGLEVPQIYYAFKGSVQYDPLFACCDFMSTYKHGAHATIWNQEPHAKFKLHPPYTLLILI